MATQVGLIWEIGWSAYFEGKTEEDNPYDKETQPIQHNEWLKGFRKAGEKDD